MPSKLSYHPEHPKDYEAIELRDNDSSAYHGMGVQIAITNIESFIALELIAKGFIVATDLEKIDVFMNKIDGTNDKRKLGANAILGVSMACARAGAASKVHKCFESHSHEIHAESMEWCTALRIHS